MEHASPTIRNADEVGYNLRSSQAIPTHLSGPDTVLVPGIPSKAFATAVPGGEEKLAEAESTPSRTADVTSSPASRTSASPTSAGTRGEHAGDARLPLDLSSAAASLGTTGQQNKKTVSGEDNLQQDEGGNDNPVNVSNPKSPAGHWLGQAELIQAHDRIEALSSDAVASAELLNQAEQENEGLRTHIELLMKRANESDSCSTIDADPHPVGQLGPDDVPLGQKRVVWRKEPAGTVTPHEKHLEMEKEALTRRMKELDRQMKAPSSASLADAQRPRGAPLDSSTSPLRHQEDSRQEASAVTIGLAERFGAENRKLQAEVARLQRQVGTSTTPPSPPCQHSQEEGGRNSYGSPGSPNRYMSLAQQQKGLGMAPPQQQSRGDLRGAEGAKGAQTAGFMELIANLTRRLASTTVLIENVTEGLTEAASVITGLAMA